MGSIVKTIGLTEQGLRNLNEYTKEATTNTSFSSNSSNNPFTLYFDDGRAYYGSERFIIGGVEAIKYPDVAYDADGKQGYYLVNAKTGLADKRFRVYGTVSLLSANADGTEIQVGTSSGNGSYVIITGVLTKVMALSRLSASTARNTNNAVWLDNVNTGNFLSQVASTTPQGQYYPTNAAQLVNIGSVSQGIHTAKIIQGSDGSVSKIMVFHGFELINESFAITACTKVMSGEEVSFPAYTGVNYKGSTSNGGQLYSGTRGGRAAWFPQKDPATNTGYYVSKNTTIEEQVQSCVADSSSTYDRLTGLTDSSKYYANSQGNVVRVKDANSGTTQDRMLLCPTSAPSSTILEFSKDYLGNTYTDVLTAAGVTAKQYREDNSYTQALFSTTSDPLTIELYAKVLGNTDHTNEEMVREIHWREFGSYRVPNDDHSTLGTAPADKSFVLDDGTTTLMSYQGIVTSEGDLFFDDGSKGYTLTFVGSGLDIDNGGKIIKVVSDLPYGTHNFRAIRVSSNYDYYIDGLCFSKANTTISVTYVRRFLVYQPKTPVLTGYSSEFSYNILADQVQTNLGTRNVGWLNPIDQGVIRKYNTREAVFTGAAFTYQIPSSGWMAYLYANAANDAQCTMTVFGGNKFRWGIGPGNTTDNFNMLVDGSTVESSVVPGANGSYLWYDTTFNMGSYGLHTVQMDRGSLVAASFGFYCLDYNTPVYEPAYCTTNPYNDLFIGNTGIGDYRKSYIVDTSRKPREYQIVCNVSSGTSVAGFTVLSGQVLDAGVYEAEYSSYFQADATGTPGVTAWLRIDMIDQPNSPSIGDCTNTRFWLLSKKCTITVTKRACVQLWAVKYSGSATWTYQNITPYTQGTPAILILKKISD